MKQRLNTHINTKSVQSQTGTRGWGFCWSDPPPPHLEKKGWVCVRHRGGWGTGDGQEAQKQDLHISCVRQREKKLTYKIWLMTKSRKMWWCESSGSAGNFQRISKTEEEGRTHIKELHTDSLSLFRDRSTRGKLSKTARWPTLFLYLTFSFFFTFIYLRLKMCPVYFWGKCNRKQTR